MVSLQKQVAHAILKIWLSLNSYESKRMYKMANAVWMVTPEGSTGGIISEENRLSLLGRQGIKVSMLDKHTQSSVNVIFPHATCKNCKVSLINVLKVHKYKAA